MAPDLILTNAAIWLGGATPENHWSLAISGNRITAIGPDQDIVGQRTRQTRILDCHGHLILPGFHDAHLHPLIGALDLLDCALMGLNDWPAYRDRIREYVEHHPDFSFIRGNGWVHAAFPPSGPHKGLLDELIPDRPAFFKAMDGHSGWFNSAALRLAAITRDTPCPEGGIIERDPQTGDPTGLFRKWPAMQLVTDHFPQPSQSELLSGAEAFLQQAARFGITAIQDASGKAFFPEVYRTLEESGRLNTLRVSLVRRFSPHKGLEQLAEHEELRQRHHSPFFRIGPLKLFMDGVVEGETAFLLEDYADRPGYRSEPVWNPEHWLQTAPELARRGWAVHIHAVGDGAVRLSLNGIAKARTANPDPGLRHQIAHADLIADSDLPRFKELGVIANLQPSWFARDSNYLGVTLPALGSARSEKLYRLRDLYNSGTSLAFSSDWPFGGDVTSFNPLIGIQAGICRTHPTNHETPLNLQQRGSLAELLTGFTRGSALAVNREHEMGTLQPGTLADIILIEPNLFAIPPEEIHQARVLLTLVDGRPVWQDPTINL